MDTVNLLSSQGDMDDESAEHNEFAMERLGLQERSEQPTDTAMDNQAKMTPQLLLATLISTLGGVLFGYDIGIVAGAMLQLRDEFSLSSFQQEVVICAMLMGALIGSLVGGCIVDAFGRRYSLIFNSIVFTVGGLILICATTFTALNFGRLILGFAVALSAIGECIYISEVSPSNLRGQLVSLYELGITVGILLAYLVSYIFISVEHGWRFMFGISIIPAIVQGCGMVILPSSPRFLIMRGKVDEATCVLQKLRNQTDVSAEINGMKAGLAIEDGYSFTDLFKTKANLRIRILIGGGLVFLQQATGQTNVVYYAPTILQQIGFESNVAATSATVGIGTIKFLCTALCFLLVDSIGRRKLLLCGVTCMMVSILVLGITCEVTPYHLQNDNSTKNLSEELVSRKETITNNPLMNTTSRFLLLKREKRDINLMYSTLTPFKTVTTSSPPPESLDGATPYMATVWNITLVTGDQSLNMTDTETSSKQEVSTTAKVISLISLACFVAAYSFSFGPVTWLLVSEIYPLGIRGRATSVATSMNWATNLVFSLTFLEVINVVGIGTLFILYGFICLLAIFFIYCSVPETKNRTLEDISKELSERYYLVCIFRDRTYQDLSKNST
ncbi:solute carrier family 2, facilitated glucose transporter member 10-like isoform X2 [Anneissia japonica]|uniref:solute carrier family 2, facilitated glucose transporter member 10-like isoform X2 n=1 Tax=Anneissia japonica TaxID=1529436 RepID=UPI0014258FA0|nr:solute carrier family 2, facilitated glucose transporter member 10-like isoform X2 [Anneissia japonica]